MTVRRVLGIDPGSRFMGYGIVEEVSGKVKPITYNVLNVEKENSFSKKMKIIFDTVTEVIAAYQPTEMALEALFFAKNVNSAIKLGQARGAIITAAAHYNIELYEYSATEVKQAVVGYGHSSKEQIQKMVGILLGINFKEQPIAFDASDALAIAVCHLHHHHQHTRRGKL